MFCSAEDIISKVLLKYFLVGLFAFVIVFKFGAHRVAVEILLRTHLPEGIVAESDAAALYTQRLKSGAAVLDTYE